jgi:excisionase family DNA binding protein
MNSPSSAHVMTVKEVAEYLRVNQRTVYRLAVERRLPGFKVGATWRFKRGDIDAWIAAQSCVVPPSEAHAAPGEPKNP